VINLVAADRFVLAALVDAKLLHRIVQMPVFFMAFFEFFDHEFLEQAHVDYVKHRHYLPQDLYAELACNRAIAVVLQNNQESLHEVPPGRAR